MLVLAGKTLNMEKNEDSGSPSWGASFFMQTTEDVARAVAAAAAAATAARTPRPSVVFSSKDHNGNSPLQKLQHHVSRVLKGFSQTPEVQNGTYNPEVLTSQKRQWASFQLQSLVCLFVSCKTLWVQFAHLFSSQMPFLLSNLFLSCLHPIFSSPTAHLNLQS